ncbi:MAG: D-alanyl-D-alanine carboxypeptidase family protein, partial [Sphingomonadales bacterium]|nr:D-alanyl-D-alanine carboxypeptidase family protein [Sphingomonadales bacterium]
AWKMMKQAAATEGIEVFIISAHRSIERQAAIVRRKLDAGEALTSILQVCAPPGYSEHHSGRAVDIGTPEAQSLTVDFESTPAFAWLMANASGYGFRLSYPISNPQGYIYEPWHWCWHTTL